MATMNAFKGTPFSHTSLTGYVNKMPYVPSMLGQMGIFQPMPVRTSTIFVDRTERGLKLIPTTPRGAPPEQLERRSRDAVTLETLRLAKEFTLYAHEVADLRATNTESELMVVQSEFNDRMAALRNDMEATHEHHRLGALQGIVYDADGTTVLYDFTTEFAEAIPAATDFAFSSDTTDVRTICHQITRSIARSGQGSFVDGQTTVHALVGDQFYDALINHPQVRQTYQNWSAAADLRQNIAFSAFIYGGITFHNYRGTDDGTTVGIASNEAKFFPVGAREMFKHVMSPMSESMTYANTRGQNLYSFIDFDPSTIQQWMKGYLFSYPLYLCQQPRMLRNGTMS